MKNDEDIAIVPYISIPAYIYKSDLGDTAQKICGLIVSLSSEYGYCFASNRYIAKLFKRSNEDLDKKEKAVARAIQRLIKDGWIQNIGTSKNRKLVLVNPAEFSVKSINKKEQKLPQKETGQKATSSRFSDEKTTSSRKKNDIKSQILHYYNIYINNNVQILQFWTSLNSKIKSIKDLEKLSPSELENLLFETFWKFYPRREQKKRALKAFKKLEDAELELLISIMHLIPERFKDVEKKFIPLPATFLNAGSYEDEVFKQLKAQNGEKICKKGGVDDLVIEDERVELAIGWAKAFLGGYEPTEDEENAVAELGLNEEKFKEFIQENGVTKARGYLLKKVEGVKDEQ